MNMATLERRFDLHSSQVAWIPASYNIAVAIFSVCYGYAGMSIHKGALLTFGAYILAVGSSIMFLPHILAGEYELGKEMSEVCDLSGT